ncbi:NAD(+)/NADH kinase [Treponema pectinovorum]|uniref:NAD(+)/NADH kinase n=1 Tax=Treponema pectinovorum TaxID=164 RepID=UPI0011C861E5|nr:NAD(+)/NADH kinase [Treponema pectinovorum]
MVRCLIIVNTYKDESQKMGAEIKAHLNDCGIHSEVFLFNGFSEQYPFSGYDFVVTLGGDGTVLFAARGCAPEKIPIIPINFGTFGFIASVQKKSWKEEIHKFLEGNSQIVRRSMIESEIIRGGIRCFSTTGLNDVVLSAKNSAHTINFEVNYGSTPLGNFVADGIIFSTSTGSTAYSASAGGPIIDPFVDVICLTLLNPFSLSSRPLVLSPENEISIKILPSRVSDVIITVDGQIPNDLHVGDTIKIHQAKDKALLVGCTQEKFYNSLRQKLNWSGGPNA